MSRLLHRQTSSVPPLATAGSGIELIDQAGNRYIDASGGAAVSCLGHGHPAVIDALHRQLDVLAYAHSGFFTTEVAERLADRLIEQAPEGLERVYLVSGGSEAMESALKMARQFAVERGQASRRHVISRHQSYHGNTLGALAAGGHAARRALYEPLLATTWQIEPCHAYRYQRDDESEAEYAERAALQLDAQIRELGSESVLAFVAEPVVGASLGAVPAVAGYFSHIAAICREHGVLLILDEVMCGMGRTGSLHACEQEGVSPDLLVIAKGLGGGYQPIGAVLLSGAIYDAFAEGSGFFQHGHTYLAHPMAAAAALAVQETIRDAGLLENVCSMGRYLSRQLSERFADHPHAGNLRGRGLFQGVELVRDRATKQPFGAFTRLHEHLKREAMDRGLMIYPGAGTADGRDGHHILLAPPYIVDTAGIDTITDRLSDAVDAALACIPAS